jgi:hypothetical protein
VRPRRTHLTDTVFRLPGGTEDNDLWVQRMIEDALPVLRSVWQPTDEERAAIANGANIELRVWGQGTPPLAVSTTDEQLGRKPPEAPV